MSNLLILSTLLSLLRMYEVLICLRLTFMWIPQINWYAQPFYGLRVLTEPFFAFWDIILPELELWGFDYTVPVGLAFLRYLIDYINTFVMPL